MYEIKVIRTYHPEGTNGIMTYNDKEVCKCIELPWLDNRPRLSCIPEGKYTVFIRETDQKGIHLYIPCVPGRNYILIYAADLSLRELQGCIIPVSMHTGPGMGINSKIAMQKLMETIYRDIMDVKPVNLIITSQQHTDEEIKPGNSGESIANTAIPKVAQGGRQ